MPASRFANLDQPLHSCASLCRGARAQRGDESPRVVPTSLRATSPHKCPASHTCTCTWHGRFPQEYGSGGRASAILTQPLTSCMATVFLRTDRAVGWWRQTKPRSALFSLRPQDHFRVLSRPAPGLHVKINSRSIWAAQRGEGVLDGTDLEDDVDKIFSYLRRMT
jgi:hypothetical protein